MCHLYQQAQRKPSNGKNNGRTVPSRTSAPAYSKELNVNSIQPQSPFDTMRQVAPDGGEFWSARDLMNALGYSTWRKFSDAIERARTSCEVMGQSAENHFVGGGKLVGIGSKAERQIEDFHLSRYACYLTAMNGDPRKAEIAAAQAYFVQQTRKAELFEQAPKLSGALVTARAICEATGYNKRSMGLTLKRKGLQPTHHYFEPRCGAPTYLYPLDQIQAQFPEAKLKAFEGEALEGIAPVLAVVEKSRVSKAALAAPVQPRLLPAAQPSDTLALARELVQLEERRAEILSALGGGA